ncbi:MAG: metal ABC transporter ATP-binding protein [Ruminococcaceae bacterium]|nr:metal ABC transporter ATP-binding protein [Oscillospiraceae bacterium]
MNCIEVRDLVLSYGTEPVITDLSFDVENGDYICIIGENGSGKTTLVKSILGLIQPVSGSITFADKKGRKGIGYLPQQQKVQHDFPASVLEVVHSGFVNSGLFSFDFTEAKRRKAHDIMHALKIEHSICNKCFRELSGGQRQKVLLARALCATDKLLLLDEPVTGLDPVSTAEMYRIIRELNNNGMTVIMISHDLRSAVCEAKKVLHISHNGFFFGSSAEYKSSDLGRAFLEEAEK